MTDRFESRPDRAPAVPTVDAVATPAEFLAEDAESGELFDRLVAGAVQLLDVEAAAILLDRRGHSFEVVASSGDACRRVELVQARTGSGASVDAIRSGASVRVHGQVALTRRWPAYGQAVVAAGFTVVQAFPLTVRQETIGALGLYGRGAADAEVDQDLARAIAEVATIALAQQRRIAEATLLVGQLQLALDSRVAIEQAKGLVAEFGGVEMSVAFEAIRSHARRHRVQLHQVAVSLVRRELDPGEVIRAR